MPGVNTPEGVVVPAAGDTFDYLGEMRRKANSQRTVVTVANRAAAEVVAAAMATDGRPVSNTNPLIVYNQEKRALEVKDGTGWYNEGHRVASFSGPITNSNGVLKSMGNLAVGASLTKNNTFCRPAPAELDKLEILEAGNFNFSFVMLGSASTGTGFLSIRNQTKAIYIMRNTFTDYITQEVGCSGTLWCDVGDLIQFEYVCNKNMNWGSQVQITKLS